MSEKSKGDTSSSSITPAPSRVVKNPLLSASVTGLTFEDFPNKPLLLPAAPPVVHAAPITPPVLGLGLLNREPKSLVTVGQNSDIDRDETLSEINLNSDENQPGPAQIDTNSNSLLEQNTNTDSILSQAASSFSALPSVASSVFSTFSKRIYSNTASRDRTPVSEDRDFNANPITEQDIQPAYTQHPQQQQQVQQQNHFSSTPPLQFGASTQSYASAPLGASNNNIGAPPTAFSGPPPPNSTQTQFAKQELPAEPPKLYTPSEVPNLNASSVAAPPPGGSNTYRLTAKKKIYAPIPGFSEATQQHQVAPILDPSIISAPITAPTQPASYDYPQPTDFYGQNQIPSKPEERKGGLFSISNLVPTGVLQNISGLVQSAAGTIAQTVAPDSLAQQQQQQQYQQQQFQPQASFDISFQPPSVGSSLSSNTYPNQPSQNFYTQPYPSEVQQQQVGLPALPPQTNFFTPTENQNPSDNPVIPVLTQLGFDQLASDINKAKIPAIPQLSENTVNESKLEGTDALKATQGPENHPESNQLETNDSSATPTAVAAASEVSPILPGTELPAAAIVPGVVPAQIPLYDPIRPPTQPVSVVSNIFFTNTSYPIRPPTQPVPNIFSAPIRPPTQPAPNNFSAPIRPPTQPVPNIYSAPIRPPTQPVPSGFFDPIRPPTQPVPSGFYDPIRPPTQPNSAASNILTPNIFSAPIRPPTQPVSASKSTANAFEPIRPPSQPTPISTPNSTPGIFSAPIRPPSQPVSASNFSANTFEPIRPPSQPTPPISTSSVPGNVSAPIRPPSQPVSAVPLNSTPTNFFAPTGTPTQPFLDPIRPPTQPAPTTNFGPNIFSAPIRPPTQPTPVGATPANFDPIRPPTQSTAATNFTPNIFSAPIRPPTQPTPAGATPVNFFDSTRPPSQNSASDLGQQLPQPNTQLTSQQATASTANNIYQAPPLSTQVPPITQPPAASGPSSFRLQKGTRLYKNPLTSAETAPASIFAPSLQPTSFVQPPPVAPQSIFNPFAATAASLEQSPALFVPGTLEEKELKEKPCVEQQSPNLFALETSPLEVSKETQQPEVSQPIGFIDPNSFTSELKTQDAFLPNKEFQSTVPEQKPSIPNIIQQSEIKLPTPSDLVLSQPVQAALETEAKNTTPLPFDSSSKVDDINANESSVTIQQEQALTENPDKSQTPEAKEEVSVNPTLRENNDDSLAASQGANFLPPPPQITAVHGLSNPYRKEYTASHTTTGTQPSLANFFTPIESDTSSDFNFFSTPAPTQQAKLNSASIFSDSKQITENLSSTAANFFQLQTPNAPSPSPQPTPSASPKPTTSSTTDKADPSLFPKLPSQTCIAPPPLFKEPPKDLNDPISVQQPTIAPPLGFDNLISSTDSSSTPIVGNASNLQSQELTTQQPPNFNSFSNFFNQSSNVCNFEVIAAKETERDLPNPTSFFDSFSPVSTQSIPVPSTNLPSDTKQQQQQQKPEQQQQEPQQEQQQERQQQQQQTNEDQRIQNFFNNPPPQELGGNVGDLNYDLVHGGLAVKTLQTRSLTPASILVEPPSSSCSEFSELNTSSAGQRQNVIIENSNKSSSEEEIKVQATIEHVNEATSENLAKAETVEDLSKYYADLPKEVLEELRMANLLTGEKAAATAPPATISTYTPAVKHWFYKKENCNKTCWTPFSHYDSALLETALTMDENNSPNIVAVEGGRFDVNIKERTKTAVYWEGKPIQVRRCSWFYKGTDSRYVPYEEETADRLEAEYKLAIDKDEWHKKVIISMGEQVVFHGPTVIVHFHQQQNIDAWGGSSQTTTRPRVVKRDLEDFHIEQGESQRVDHLLLMVHGIGSVCDLKMRTVEEVVDDFRSIAQQLVSSHYKNSTEMGLVGRVEILPISWHSHLHSAEMGIDDKLKAITLESIPKLRYFANDTLLDVLFYTSPTYCQKIMNTVANSMNSIYVKYRQRNPDFNGGVSVAGHSLGSLILFDMLCHQKPIKEFEEKENMENPDQRFPSVPSTFFSTNSQDNTTSDVGYMTGVAGTGQPFIHYEQLLFHPKKFFAIGSPIGVFVTIRGIDKLGVDFRLPTCPGFYNIFHPFDPIAYRIEALINPDMAGIRPVLIPHHKGRKRMHLELRETMTRVGADLKQRFMDTFRNTLDSVNFLGSSTSLRPGSKDNENVKETMEKEVDKVLNMQSDMDQTEVQFHDVEKTPSHTRQRSDSASTSISDTDMVEIDFPLGKLNDSKRIDYVLQEAPLEFFNEYLFALSSHVGYWESEDTILFVMKEIYTGLGVSPDSQVPQQSMTIERPSSRNTQHDHATTPT